jgi:hypothetical protein
MQGGMKRTKKRRETRMNLAGRGVDKRPTPENPAPIQVRSLIISFSFMQMFPTVPYDCPPAASPLLTIPAVSPPGKQARNDNYSWLPAGALEPD